MFFHSWSFVLCLAVFFLAYHSLRRLPQNLLLLVGSYLFLAVFDWRFLGLVMGYTLVNYLGGRLMAGSVGPRRRTWLMAVLGLDLGGLAFFKYYNFFVDSAAALLTALGLTPHLATLQIILPVGISFYTFMSVGYSLDVYRGRLEPEKNPFYLAMFLSYFPLITAGPIERAGHLLPQFHRARVVSGRDILSGAFLFLLGLVRKVGVADALAAQVDPAFANPQSLDSQHLIVSLFLYFLLLYCDFAGYSDMARGVSRMLGIELMRNFEQPYFATSIADFWRRWHISLSSWLRDYLYIPLGGSRGSSLATYRNLMLTMLLCGLWHGPAWHYVAWGGMMGVALSVHRAWSKAGGWQRWRLTRSLGPLTGVVSWALTMLVTAVGWVIFRSADLTVVGNYLGGILALRGGFDPSLLITPALMTALFLLLELPQRLQGTHTAILTWPRPLQALVIVGMLVWLVLAPAPPEHKAFVYLQF